MVTESTANSVSGLIKPRVASVTESSCEINESILLDTSGAPSLLAVTLLARGLQARMLREQLESQGLEAFSGKRLALYGVRFAKAHRVGPVEFRDDPEAHVFSLSEIFEIKDFLSFDPKSRWFKLEINNFPYFELSLVKPECRVAPVIQRFPWNVRHTVELHSLALAATGAQHRSVDGNSLRFTRARKSRPGCWTMTWTVSTLADSVPSEMIDEHCRTLHKIREQSSWSIMLPPGDPRPRQRTDFGALPDSAPAPLSADAPMAPILPVSRMVFPVPQTADPRKLKRHKRSRRKRKIPSAKAYVGMACLMAVALIVITVFAAKFGERFSLFRWHVSPPPVPANSIPPH